MLTRERWSLRVVSIIVVGSAASWTGHAVFVSSHSDRQSGLREELAGARQRIEWYGTLEEHTSGIRRRLEEVGDLERRIQPFLLSGMEDRLRLTLQRDELLRRVPGLGLVPMGGAPEPVPIPVFPVVDLARELDDLKRRYQHLHPGEAFDDWGGPAPIEVLQFTESFLIKGSYDSVLKFIVLLESAPLFMEVTDLKLEELGTESREDLLRANLTVSSISFRDPSRSGDGGDPR